MEGVGLALDTNFSIRAALGRRREMALWISARAPA
jgi:hypothetical protein